MLRYSLPSRFTVRQMLATKELLASGGWNNMTRWEFAVFMILTLGLGVCLYMFTSWTFWHRGRFHVSLKSYGTHEMASARIEGTDTISHILWVQSVPWHAISWEQIGQGNFRVDIQNQIGYGVPTCVWGFRLWMHFVIWMLLIGSRKCRWKVSLSLSIDIISTHFKRDLEATSVCNLNLVIFIVFKTLRYVWVQKSWSVTNYNFNPLSFTLAQNSPVCS